MESVNRLRAIRYVHDDMTIESLSGNVHDRLFIGNRKRNIDGSGLFHAGSHVRAPTHRWAFVMARLGRVPSGRVLVASVPRLL